MFFTVIVTTKQMDNFDNKVSQTEAKSQISFYT